jgi:hypothetical protein
MEHPLAFNLRHRTGHSSGDLVLMRIHFIFQQLPVKSDKNAPSNVFVQHTVLKLVGSIVECRRSVTYGKTVTFGINGGT